MYSHQLEFRCFCQPTGHIWYRTTAVMKTVPILPYTSSWEHFFIWIITLVNSVLMSLMVSVTSFKSSPVTIEQTIMQGKPEGMATSEWQVIPQCVLCPQSDPISFPPNSAISSKHGHFGLQKKTKKNKTRMALMPYLKASKLQPADQ